MPVVTASTNSRHTRNHLRPFKKNWGGGGGAGGDGKSGRLHVTYKREFDYSILYSFHLIRGYLPSISIISLYVEN